MKLDTKKFDANLTKLAAEYDSNVLDKEKGSSTEQQSTDTGFKTTGFQFGNTVGWSKEQWKEYYEKVYPEHY